jgi:hypothetical protein
MKYEIIENGNVVNTIEADESFVLAVYGEGNYRAVAEVVAPEPEAQPLPRHITVGSFFDRFGQHKWPILGDQNPLVQALIKDCSVRKFVNLDDPQLAAGLGLLVAAGHDIDPQAIVSAEIADSERP